MVEYLENGWIRIIDKVGKKTYRYSNGYDAKQEALKILKGYLNDWKVRMKYEKGNYIIYRKEE